MSTVADPFLRGAIPVLAIIAVIALAADHLWLLFPVAFLAGLVAWAFNGFERGRKRCPECAERVRRAAHRCRHCGHQFAA